jgi:hypothetical protein
MAKSLSYFSVHGIEIYINFYMGVWFKSEFDKRLKHEGVACNIGI